MKFTESEIQEKVGEALKSSLQRVPFIQLESLEQEPSAGNIRADLLAMVSIARKRQRIVIEVKSNGQPRIVRAAVNQLLRYREYAPDVYYVFAAPYITSRSAEICTEEEIGYLDLAGNCRLAFDQVYIEQGGRPNPFAEKRDLRTLYSPKAERILRVLLSDRKINWRVKPLAAEAEVSLGQVSNVKKLLEDREWLAGTKGGLLLGSPAQLLAEWAENYRFRRNTTRNFYTLKSVAETEADLAELCRQREIPYALTGFSAAARYASAVRYQRAMAYVCGSIDEIADLLSLKEVASGANVTLISPYDAGVLYGRRSVDGIKVAMPIQAYLDLLDIKGQGEEAADVLLNEVISKSW
ncbi:Transcriptional regulator, AbiEi antitoxin, Type IV TA system [Desulfonatronum thiosulfatophilum]|uniref:Transcriptional regulator, AbiEi antitoxin, Type IV TA system n=1 Tax=Desulfonatronum thiosulfatophilum TaxID=617002 RepID=A0A1G6EUK4_9BACT|nr:type IV toxin-antitoxin system AbiEi family antitoxin [Desulfonatronum thiosulfatophilum]SDB61078.1 Transcriptional regulator, AbiEi antitoxin, Type IV TA system [Desulfonatronum thiosulfatophilum]